jgi:anti-sigma regulatory factor (Ser/Thr protein kinase)/serine/threonine protein phosphatase PrpC
MTLLPPDKAHSLSTFKTDILPIDKPAVEISIEDEFSIYPVLRAAEELNISVGLSEVQLKETEIALKELVTNVLKYGGGRGVVRFKVERMEVPTLVMEVEDWGRGIVNFYQALEDGFSTGGGLGGGLPAVNRMMDGFKLISRPNGGALFRAFKKASCNFKNLEPLWRFSVYSRPILSEKENGDGYFIKRHERTTLIAIVDGLGHGQEAHRASQIALRYIEQFHQWEEEDLINLIHVKLHGTRGIILAIVKIFEDSAFIRYTGVGNISGTILGKNVTNFLNYNGTVGLRLRKFKTLEYKYHDEDIMVLHTDGISLNWLSDYDLSKRWKLQNFTQEIIRRYSRQTDDATIIAGCCI